MEFNIELLFSIFVFFSIIVCIWSVWINKMKKHLKIEKEKLLKKQYPDLTNTDKRYRETCIREYYKHYFIKFPRLYNTILIMIIILQGIMIGCYFSDNFSGIFLALAIYIFLSLLLQFLTPSIEKQQDFWTKYLEQYPDNPLKIILYPMEKSKRIAKQLKLRAVFGFLLVIYTLFVSWVLFYQGYIPPF